MVMANRVSARLPTPFLFRYFLSRHLNSVSSPTIAAVESPPIHLTEKASPATQLDLTDTKALFHTLPSSKLLRSCAILHASAVEPIVDVGRWVMKSRLLEIEPLRNVVLSMIRRTFYEHFCGGEDTVATGNTVRRLNEAGLRCMLDYAMEFVTDNAACDQNRDEFLRTVEMARSLPPGSVSFVVVKISAICPLQLLERLSDLLRWQHKSPSFSLPWKLNTFPILADSSPLFQTSKQPAPLSPEEEKDLQLAQQRLLRICQKCADANVHLCVDAEHASVQPAIDYFTYSSAVIHNKDDNPLVYNTMQAYLKDSKDRLLLATQAAEQMGVPLGFKLVRGAYISMERELASSLGSESPVHNSIHETHNCYNSCASFMLDKVSSGPGGVVLATHNVESGKLAVAKALDIGVGKLNQKLEFAQLYGMAESLSFGLRNAGFQVSKYLPYGAVDVVIPYLLRRAEENRGLLSSSSMDRQLMSKELKRRLKASLVGKAEY